MRVHCVGSGVWATAERVVFLLRPGVLAVLAVLAAVVVVVAVVVEVEAVPGPGVGAGIEPRVMPLCVSCVERGRHLDPWARSCEAFSSSSLALVQLGLLSLAWDLASFVVGH